MASGNILLISRSASQMNRVLQKLVSLEPNQSKKGQVFPFAIHADSKKKERPDPVCYSQLSTSLAPIAWSKGERAGQKGEPLYREGNLLASYVHLYFPSNPEAVAKIVA
uniref:Cobyrinic acid a,c-diamide synthase n=1 Tax=Candidatus Kentrum sp. FW TaxID=2126338 RepID=A0A450TGG6_9GAMM|nr:MAG: hypothetical protein BECKFW1821C_GA0114237_100924 [Candidatus Kentron sp. FW]